MPADATGPAIETAALTKRFGRSRAVEDLSLGYPVGEVFGFLGPNGTGKTTTGSAITDRVDVPACGGLIGAGALLAVAGFALFERRDVAR